MATLVIKTLDRSGLDLTNSLVAAAVGGDEFFNDGKETFFAVKNASGGPITATIVTQKTVDESEDLAVDDLAVVVADGVEELIGPFPRSIYNDASGNVQVTYSAVASVTVTPVRIARD